MIRRLAPVLSTPILAILAVLVVAAPASAASAERKLEVLSSWTQQNVNSSNAWNTARQHQGDWAEFNFDWSTDLCSASPDQPLGFDFRLSCHRHDFGYRNYKAVGLFPANKARVDSAFYDDLKRKCGTYNSFVRPACLSLAWTYYEAVATFGDLSVSQSSLEHAAGLKAHGEAARQAASTGAV